MKIEEKDYIVKFWDFFHGAGSLQILDTSSPASGWELGKYTAVFE